MSYNNKYSNKKTYKVQNNEIGYRPSLFGKIALCISVPAAIIGIISVILALAITSQTGNFFVVCLIAEAIAFVGGICIVIDIVISNNKNRKKLEKTGQIPKKEKDLANIVHLIVGLGLGILLGYLIWGIR